MAANIYKMLANVPVSGVLKAAYHAPTKNPQYSDQIKVQGNFDGAVGQATIYLPLGALPTFEALGLIVPTGGNDRDGLPAYRVSPAHFQMCKVERGPMQVTLTGQQGAPPPAQHQQRPQQPAQHAQQPAQQPHQGAQQPQQANVPISVRVAQLNATMAACIKAANLAWKDGLGLADDGKPMPVPYDVVASSAHCLFIQRTRDNLLSPPPKGSQPAPALASPERKKELTDLAGQIGLDVGAWIQSQFKVAADQLTEAQAVDGARRLRVEIAEREKARRAMEAAQEQPQADYGGDSYGDAYEGPATGGEDIPY